MKTIYLGDEKFTYEDLSDLKDELIKHSIKLGYGCELGNCCKLGYGCKLGDGCELGDDCELDYGCELGDRCKLPSRSSHPYPLSASNLYKYHVSATFVDNVPYIQLGCFVRKLAEWEKDFWNNPGEFPNDGSEKSNMRLFAFETAKRWLVMVKKETKPVKK